MDFPGESSGQESTLRYKDMGLISGWRAKMPHTMGQLDPTPPNK